MSLAAQTPMNSPVQTKTSFTHFAAEIAPSTAPFFAQETIREKSPSAFGSAFTTSAIALGFSAETFLASSALDVERSAPSMVCCFSTLRKINVYAVVRLLGFFRPSCRFFFSLGLERTICRYDGGPSSCFVHGSGGGVQKFGEFCESRVVQSFGNGFHKGFRLFQMGRKVGKHVEDVLGEGSVLGQNGLVSPYQDTISSKDAPLFKAGTARYLPSPVFHYHSPNS